MKNPSTGMRNSGAFARNETRRGARQKRKTGSTKGPVNDFFSSPFLVVKGTRGSAREQIKWQKAKSDAELEWVGLRLVVVPGAAPGAAGAVPDKPSR